MKNVVVALLVSVCLLLFGIIYLRGELSLAEGNVKTLEEAVELQREALVQKEEDLLAAAVSLKLARAQITELKAQLASVLEVDPKWVRATQLDHQWAVSSGDHLEALIIKARDSARGELRELLKGVQVQLYEHREAEAHLHTALRMQLRSLRDG